MKIKHINHFGSAQRERSDMNYHRTFTWLNSPQGVHEKRCSFKMIVTTHSFKRKTASRLAPRLRLKLQGSVTLVSLVLSTTIGCEVVRKSAILWREKQLQWCRQHIATAWALFHAVLKYPGYFCEHLILWARSSIAVTNHMPDKGKPCLTLRSTRTALSCSHYLICN